MLVTFAIAATGSGPCWTAWLLPAAEGTGGAGGAAGSTSACHGRDIGSDGDQRGDRQVGELGPAVQEGQLKQYGDARHPGARALHQVSGGAGGTAGGQDVVDDQDAIAGVEGVSQHLDRGGA